MSAARLRGNFAAIRTVAGPEFEPLAVIKADAYGHGAALCAPVLAEAGARWFGVTDAEEGERVREALRGVGDARAHIVVMSGFEPADAEALVRTGLTPVVWTPQHVEALERAAGRAEMQVSVHLEIDTGMARQGATPGPKLAAVLAALCRAGHVRCEGVFSHLSSSEVVGSAETALQRDRFGGALKQAAAAGVRPEWVHLGNSSAVDEGSTLGAVREQADALGGRPLVRPGLALYGYVLPLAGSGQRATEETSGGGAALRTRLRAVATWKTRVIGVREIAAGDTVGYGATFLADRLMRLALLPIGYADGFRREASSAVGDGWVVIAGRRAAVVGRVSMNLTMVDVTGHAGVQEGDEVVLLGEGVTAEDHALWCGTIPYEILCGMGGHRRLV